MTIGVPIGDLSASSNGTRATPRVTTTNSHPFTRLDEASDMNRQSNAARPLNNVSWTIVTKQGSVDEDDIGGIKVRTDLELSSF